MTHKDIYTKFMIEYDKAGASTSYPSLTEYEVATVLDKAYNALIAQKVTGNNYRRATFESDIKSIADLGPLVDTHIFNGVQDTDVAPNVYKFNIATYKKNVPSPLLQYRLYSAIAANIEMVDDGESDSDQSIYVLIWLNRENKFAIQDLSENDPISYYSSTTDQSTQEMLDDLNQRITNDDPFYLYGQGENPSLYYFTGNTAGVVDSITNDRLVDENTRLLYFIQGSMQYNGPKNTIINNNGQNEDHFFTATSIESERVADTVTTNYNPIDGIFRNRNVPVKLVNHEMAQRFFTSASNIPWIKQPVCFIEGDYVYVVYDPLNPPEMLFKVTYIKQPNTFVKDLGVTPGTEGTCSYFDWDDSIYTTNAPTSYQFECNSTVAEELVSLAVAFALENVESQRLNSKLNMRGLEA